MAKACNRRTPQSRLALRLEKTCSIRFVLEKIQTLLATGHECPEVFRSLICN
jgi:hypothetical protein